MDAATGQVLPEPSGTSLEEISRLQNEALADDIPLSEGMQSWTNEDVRSYFESGGQDLPFQHTLAQTEVGRVTVDEATLDTSASPSTGDSMVHPTGSEKDIPADAMVKADNPVEVVIEPGCSGGACTASPFKYCPLHPDLFGGDFREEWLAESFRAAIADGSEKALRSMLHEEIPGRVFSFEMLKPDVCEWILDEMDNYERSGLPVQRPNSMNNVRHRAR